MSDSDSDSRSTAVNIRSATFFATLRGGVSFDVEEKVCELLKRPI